MNHAQEAADMLDGTNPHGSPTEAAAHATLALVEQQRIANLIALCDATWANGSAAFPRLNDAARDAVTREGLGL